MTGESLGDDRLLELAREAAGQARAGEQVEVYCARASETTVRVFEGEVESLSAADTEGIGVRVVHDHRQGFAWAGSLSADIVAETLAEARDNASFATADDHVGLPEPDGVAPAALDLWHEGLAALPTAGKVDLARELERIVRALDPRVRQVPHSTYGDDALETVLVTTTGIEARTRRTRCSVSTEALAGSGDETQTGYGHSTGREPAELDLEAAAGDAVRRATRMLGARKPPTGHVVAVLEPEVTATLLSVLAGTLSGDAVLKGRSLFADRLGEQVSAPSFTLAEDPTDPAAYGAAAFDAEGLATRRTTLIENGVLAAYLYDAYTGRRAGMPSTASAVRGGFKSAPRVGARAIAVRPGSQSPEQIMASVGHGLLVQDVIGVHSGVNPVSGDFSVGAEGLLIRDGGLAEPVREITIASTIQRMLQQVLAVGSDLTWLPAPAAGVTLAVDGITMSGT